MADIYKMNWKNKGIILGYKNQHVFLIKKKSAEK
jgi:hypothetical protein